MAQGRFTWEARHRSRPMPGQSKNCVLPMDPHSGNHEGSPHEVPRVHARTLSPTVVGNRSHLPPPSCQRPKHSDLTGVERKPLWGKNNPLRRVYVFVCLPPGKVWHKAVLRGKPGTDRDPCRASLKIACFLWILIRGTMKVPLMRFRGCTREPSPHSGRQPKSPTSTQLSKAEAQ